MKVKSFHFYNDYDCDYEINRFIKDKEVVDIKLSTGKYGTYVLIMYK